MASTSTVPNVFDMAELHFNGLGVPILFPVNVDGHATVSSLRLSIRFGLLDTSLWIEQEVYEPLILILSHSLLLPSLLSKDSSIVWRLNPGKYRVYSLSDSQMPVPTELLIPPQPSTSTIPPLCGPHQD